MSPVFSVLFAIAAGVFSLSSPPQPSVSHPPPPPILESSWDFAKAWVDEGDVIAASKIYNESLRFASSLPTTEEQLCGDKVTRKLMKREDARPYKQLWVDCLNGVNLDYANAIASQQ